MNCQVEGCPRTHKAKNYCEMHYHRLRKNGDPLVTRYPNRRAAPVSRESCGVAECDRDSYALRLCRLHHKRIIRFGSTELPTREPIVCSEDGCERPAHARGLCGMHVKRVYARGTTEPRSMPSDEERFWTKVPHRGQDECWEWMGSRHPSGHGYVAVGGRVSYAHRYSLELALGRSLGGKRMACHHCDNPPCVNPAHLYEGDAQSNVDDMWRRGRANPGGRRLIPSDVA